MNSDVSKQDASSGATVVLPEPLLIDPRPDRCKGCCDDDTTQLNKDDSSSPSTEVLTSTIKSTASYVGDKIADTILPGSVGSSSSSRSRSKSKSSPVITKTKSRKEIKQFTTLTIGSLDLGLSGKDCPKQSELENKIQSMPDVFFIQNRNKNSKRIFSDTRYKYETNANNIGQKFVSMYFNRNSAVAVQNQAGIIIYKAPGFNIANIQLNSKSYIDDIKKFLKESTKDSLEKKLKVFNETPEKIKKQREKIDELLTSINKISRELKNINDTDTKEQKEVEIKKKEQKLHK